jgi:hypothetical protein
MARRDADDAVQLQNLLVERARLLTVDVLRETVLEQRIDNDGFGLMVEPLGMLVVGATASRAVETVVGYLEVFVAVGALKTRYRLTAHLTHTRRYTHTHTRTIQSSHPTRLSYQQWSDYRTVFKLFHQN